MEFKKTEAMLTVMSAFFFFLSLTQDRQTLEYLSWVTFEGLLPCNSRYQGYVQKHEGCFSGGPLLLTLFSFAEYVNIWLCVLLIHSFVYYLLSLECKLWKHREVFLSLHCSIPAPGIQHILMNKWINRIACPAS